MPGSLNAPISLYGTHELRCHSPDNEEYEAVMEDLTYRKLYELSRDGIMLVGEEGFIDCNQAALDMFKCPTLALFCSKHPSEFSPLYQPCGGLSSELSRQRIQTAMEEGHCRFDWMHQRLNGEEFFAEVLLSPAKWGGLDVLQGVVRDVSERKKMEQELRLAKETAEQSNKAKSEFLAIISHELRTPIHGIIAAQELLLISNLSNLQREEGTLVLHSAQILLSTVNDILDFTKIEAGKLDLENIPFSPAAVLDESLQLLNKTATQKNLELNLVYETPPPKHLLGDPNRIRQILLNLCGNAIKFTEQGSVTIRNRFGGCGENHTLWTIDVIDTGIGMTDDQKCSVFDQFVQADTTTSRKYGGTGLGLSISKALAVLMNGQINVESKKHSGSTFSISLCLPITEKAKQKNTDTQTKHRRRYNKHALVAEDNPINQIIVKRQLQLVGISFDVVENGIMAIEHYKDDIVDKTFDVIFMDLQMPVMGGIETTRKLREAGCKLPIVALTADAIKGRKEDCLDAGMNEFLSKPFGMDELTSLLDKLYP